MFRRGEARGLLIGQPYLLTVVMWLPAQQVFRGSTSEVGIKSHVDHGVYHGVAVSEHVDPEHIVLQQVRQLRRDYYTLNIQEY